MALVRARMEGVWELLVPLSRGFSGPTWAQLK